MGEEFKEIEISNDEISEYVATKLYEQGLIPTDNEIEVLGDIFFDYLVEKGVIEEEKDIDGYGM
jgi:hypothetical protein